MNTMYALVAARSREIGTLHALGFSKVSILAAFVVESTFLTIGGGALGCLLALRVDGMTAAAMGTNFGESAFAFRISGTSLVVAGGVESQSFQVRKQRLHVAQIVRVEASGAPRVGSRRGGRRRRHHPIHGGFSGLCRWQDLHRKRHVPPQCREVLVAGYEEAAGVARRQCEQQVILQPRQPDGLMIRKHVWQQAACFEPAGPPRRRLQRNQSAHQPHHATGPPARHAPEQLARYYRRQPHRRVAGRFENVG